MTGRSGAVRLAGIEGRARCRSIRCYERTESAKILHSPRVGGIRRSDIDGRIGRHVSDAFDLSRRGFRPLASLNRDATNLIEHGFDLDALGFEIAGDVLKWSLA